MSEELIARIIMLPNGDVHIALKDKHTLKCTARNLFSFLSSPLDFIRKEQFSHKETTHIVNPQKSTLDRINGLTLMKVYDDLNTVCVFPKLFEALLSDVISPGDDILNLHDYIYSADISDEKHLLLRFFCEITNSCDKNIKLINHSKISESSQAEIMKETYDSFFLSYIKNSSPKSTHKKDRENEELSEEVISQESESKFAGDIASKDIDLNDDYITVEEFARTNSQKVSTVRGWLHKEKIRDVKRVKEGKNTRVYINKNTPLPEDGRKGRPMPKKILAGMREFIEDGRLENATYNELQRYMEEREGVSTPIRKRITNYEEIKYYRTRFYHEVNWDGQYALIIDINPEYYCERLGKTNRQLIADEKSPVVPDRDEVVYDLHHIGQENDSPLAIVPSDHHLQTYNSIFHSRGIQESKINRKNFESIKKSFWKTYIEIYDTCLGFKNISKTSLHTEYENKRKG